MQTIIRALRHADLAPILALNNDHATELSWLDEAGLRDLVATAFYGKRVDDAVAFLLAFDQDAPYDSPNFLWFKERHDRFVYVDRIVAAPAQRGRGLAKSLYEDLFDAARVAGHDMVCCEVNVMPPNPASDRFHEAFGFREIGRADLTDRDKTVRYLTRSLEGTEP